MPGILKWCEREGIDESRTKHLLNLLGFRRMLETFSTNRRSSENSAPKGGESNESVSRNAEEGTGNNSQSNVKQESSSEFEIQKSNTSSNLFRNDLVTAGDQNASRVSDSLSETLNIEMDKVPETEHHNIIFDEKLAESSCKENEKSKFSLNDVTEQIRIRSNLTKQDEINIGDKEEHKKENINNFRTSISPGTKINYKL